MLLTYGFTNLQIAELLTVGERTIDTHVRRGLAKLAVRTRYGAACRVLLVCPDVRFYDVWR